MSSFWIKLKKTLPLLVKEAEKACKDGVITPEERKQQVMTWINIICEEFGIDLNWFTRWIISMIVNALAKKLPSKDIRVPLIYKKF